MARRLAFAALAAALCAWPGLVVLGQSASRPETQVPGQVEQSLGTAAQSREAAEKAGTLGDLEDLSVDDEAILRNPDDVGLSYRLALKRIREGRLEMAASALQRILLVAPDLTAVRLLYGIVLYRLDDLLEAEVELRSVQAVGGPPEAVRTAGEYLDRIAERRRAFRGIASLGVGLTHDSNRNAFPVSDRGLFSNILQPAGGARTSDIGWTTLGNAAMTYDPGSQRVRDIFADVSLLSVNQERVRSLDTVAAVADLGVTLHTGIADFKPALFSEAIGIGHQDYLHTGGAQLGLSRHLAADVTGFALARISYEDYRNSSLFPTNTDQNGVLYDGRLGANYFATPSLTLTGSYEAAYKDAHTAFNSYWSHVVRFDGNYVLPWRSFVLLTASTEWRAYQGPDPFVSNSATRFDRIYDVRLTYGVPIDSIIAADFTKGVFRDLVLNLFGEYVYNGSRVPNYDWRAWRLGGLLTKSIAF